MRKLLTYYLLLSILLFLPAFVLAEGKTSILEEFFGYENNF